MEVVSLFDGISCGMIALEKAGLNVDNYYSFEIDKNAIKISNNNYPEIIRCGDVINFNFSIFRNIDLLIGGLPCQDLSSMGSHKGLKGDKSKLFFEYVRVLKEIKPKYFLFENNFSIGSKNAEIITSYLGVEPIMINSADFSAQIRKRYYWTNIPILDYETKKLTLKDVYCEEIKHEDITDKVMNYLYSPKYENRKIKNTVKYSIKKLNEQSRTIATNSYQIGSNSGLILYIDGRYYRPNIREFERLQTLPDGYCYSDLTINQRIKLIGNGWTVDVIAHILRGLVKNGN